MHRKHQKTLKAVFNKPISGNIKWSDIESLFIALGGEISERAGSRVAVILDGEVQVYHRPHPQPTTDKGAIASVRKWLDSLGYNPNDDTLTDAPVTHKENDNAKLNDD